MLEQVEETSTNLGAVHAVLWKAYEGMVGIQDAFGKVHDVNRMVNTIHNKLSILRDAKESLQIMPVHVKDEDIDCKLKLETEDTRDSNALK